MQLAACFSPLKCFGLRGHINITHAFDNDNDDNSDDISLQSTNIEYANYDGSLPTDSHCPMMLSLTTVTKTLCWKSKSHAAKNTKPKLQL